MEGGPLMRRVTIKDIARMAGVSVTTVSRALNNAPEISPETRERILELCREEGYRTNLLARSLISSRTNVIGVILSDISGPFHASLALHIETCAAQLGYQVMLCSGQPGSDRIDQLFDLLISQGVDGILLTSASNSAIPLLERYQSAVPTVLIGATFAPVSSSMRINSVCTDNYVGGQMAARYLHSLGHRQVAYLGVRQGSDTHLLRHRGFLDAAAELDMTVDTVWNPASHSTSESGYQMGRRFFLKPFSHTAVFAVSDLVALGIMQAADELGIAIPEQLSLLGFDNIDYASLPKIRLTTISQRTEALAGASVRLLTELIRQSDGMEFTQCLLTPELIQRDTCREICTEHKAAVQKSSRRSYLR